MAEKTSNLCYTFGMANDEEPIKKALMASSLVVVTSEDSVDSNLATLMVDSGASGHNFDDDIILNLKHRLQDYVHLAMPRKILNAGELFWTVRRKAYCKAMPPTTTAIKSSFESISWWCPELGTTCSRW